MSRPVSIYVLCEPGTDIVRYVGITTLTLKQRLAHHFKPTELGKKSHKNSWLKSLRSKGLKPDIKIIRIVTDSNWQYYEKFYIDLYRSLGHNLTNYAEGGQGSLGYKLTKKQRERQRKGVINRAYKHSPEVRAKMSASKQGELNPMYGKKGPLHPRHIADRTHCKNGHVWSEKNIYISPQGKKACRACANVKSQEYRNREKIA